MARSLVAVWGVRAGYHVAEQNAKNVLILLAAGAMVYQFPAPSSALYGHILIDVWHILYKSFDLM